jgi:sugar phosphate isomerase/epimerase
VDFKAVIAKLKVLEYDRFITIEREISGEQQVKDIKDTKAYLESLISH